MAAPPFQIRVPAHYLSAYVDIRRLKKKLESLVQRAQRQRATVRRRLDILQRPRMLPYGRAQKPTSPAAAGEQQDVDSPASLSASTDPSHTHFLPSAAAAAARADDGMAGSSLRAEAETLSLLPEAQFWGLLQQQVNELNKFATEKERQIQSDIRLIAARMEQHEKLQGDEELLIEEQSAEIIHLDLYIRTNHKALLALCSHFDRLLTGAKTARWFSTSLLKEAYCNVDLERLVLMLSLLWGKFRSRLNWLMRCIVGVKQTGGELCTLGNVQEGKQLESAAWKPPDSFVRATTKYWIRPENIVRAQCLIVRHLPFLVFGTSDKELRFISVLRKTRIICGSYYSSNWTQVNHRSHFCTDTPQYFCCDVVMKTVYSNKEASLLGPRSALEKLQQRASNLAPTQMVASVYFDSANAYSYERRIRRFEGAQLLRFRWYGTNNNGPDEDIFIERKTHHESWSGLSSTKERFVVPQRLVAPYMLLQRKARDLLLEASGFEPPETDGGQSPGDPTVSSAAKSSKPDSVDSVTIDTAGIAASEYIAKNGKLKKAIELGEEIQEEIAEHQLQPMLRTSYLRAAFQLATSNAVRISLDTNLCMVNEYRPQRQEYGGFNWCRLADELLGKDEVVRFPYAILEVKVQQQPPPAWVQSMLLLADATLVYKFSKFQHGMAFLHRDKISSGLLPHWLQTPLSAQQQNQDEQSSANKKRSGLGVPALGGSLFESLRNSPDSLLTPLARSLADQHAPRLSPSDALGVKRRSLFPVGEGKPVVATEPDWEDVTATAAHRTFCWLQTEQQLQLQQAPRPICQDSSAEGEFEEERTCGVILSSADSMQQRLMRRHIRTVRKVDPKTSFAGERTFLHYIQKGLYLAGASLACLQTLSGSWGLAVVLILACACALLCCGAYTIYAKRCQRISQRVAKAGVANVVQRIDSRLGPVLAFIAAGVATVLVLVFQIDVNLRSVLHHQRADNLSHYRENVQPASQ